MVSEGWGPAEEVLGAVNAESMFAKDWMRRPSVFSWSSLALFAAANWRRFAKIGLLAAAIFTWLIKLGVIGVIEASVSEDIKGVETTSDLGLGVDVAATLAAGVGVEEVGMRE